MSAHGRKRGNGRAQLMLLRGGLDDLAGSGRGGASAAAMADEADWQAFCARIGWQEPLDVGPEVEDDYADRLAQKIFGGTALFDGSAAGCSTALFDGSAASCSTLRDNVIELAVEREAKATKEAPVTESALRRATARGALLALSGVAAAAVVCFFGASVLSAAGGMARAVPADDPVAPEPAVAPVAQPLESATPAPTDSTTAPTKPPGSLVAQRGSRHRSRGRAVAQAVVPAQDHHAEIVQTALSAPVPLAEMIDIRPGALHAFEGPVTVPDLSASPVGELRDIAALTPRHVGGDTRSDVRGRTESVAWSAPVVTSRGREAGPNWGLTSASQRWYGMGVAPTYEPSSLPAGMTVMAQVDVGKALKL